MVVKVVSETRDDDRSVAFSETGNSCENMEVNKTRDCSESMDGSEGMSGNESKDDRPATH